MIYDAVLCVSEKHKDIALLAIRSLSYFSDSRVIFVITAAKNFEFFERNLDPNIPFKLLDEDEVVPGLTIRSIQNLLLKYFGDCRDCGWFLQQFLKMGICHSSELAENYLIWDGDTLMLQKIAFFGSNSEVFVVPNQQLTDSYFTIMEKIVGCGRQVDFSFVSEHLMVKKIFMEELINLIQEKSSESSWFEYIVASLDRWQITNRRGFSEFETYGNFVAWKHPNHWFCRELKCSRYGSMMCGHVPERFDLFWLMVNGYSFVTFEKWMGPSKRRLAANKSRNWLTYQLSQLVKCSRFLMAVDQISPLS